MDGIRHNCYFLSSDKRDWQSSEEYCVKHHSHLVKIEDAKKNEWIKTKLPTGDHVLWVGGNDIKNEGTWVWVSDSSPFSYQAWYRGSEPNGGSRENCLNIIAISKEHAAYGKWNDYVCTEKLFYMCERQADSDEET